jgi:hypothetical protein
MLERLENVAGKPMKFVARAIAYEPSAVIHIDIVDGETIVAAARVMAPYHQSLKASFASMPQEELAAKVLMLFASQQLSLTLDRTLQIQALLGNSAQRVIVPAYQHPWQADLEA